MKKLFTIALMACALVSQAKVYTLSELATLVPVMPDGTGVAVVDGAYVVNLPTELPDGTTGITFDDGNIVLSKKYFTINGDLLVLDGETLLFDGATEMEINGDLTATNATFGAAEGAEATAKGFRIYKEGMSVALNKCTFNYVGINYGNGVDEGNFVAVECLFDKHNSKGGNSAINFTSYSTNNVIQDCTFEDNALASIASGANVSIGIIVSGCKFNKPQASTRLYPSINLNAGTLDIIIEDNEVHGPAVNTRAGGIAVANLLGGSSAGTVYVRRNFVENCSYGITLTGPGNIVMEENTVLNNKYIANVNQGGSGLNITCNSAGMAKAYMRGNHIEGNVWGVTVIGNVDINAGKVEDPTADDYNPGQNVFKDNGNGDPFVQYDWYNNTAATSYAQGNTWSVEVQDEEHIEQVIVHKNDDPSLGEVIYLPSAGDLTGIGDVKAADKTNAGGRFNIMGQPVGADYRGIVIDNGKKVLVK